MILRPLYLDRIMTYVDTPFVKILTGVRRCGKSTILKMIMQELQTKHNISPEQILSYRFDSMEYEDMTAKDMFHMLKEKLSDGGHDYLFLDEVQEINGWERVVNSLSADYDVDISDCVVNCSTCKNNVEFPPPHTCDICTSLDQEEEFSMWEAKE